MDDFIEAARDLFRIEHQELFDKLAQKDKLILKQDQELSRKTEALNKSNRERSKLEKEINVLKQKVLELSKNSNSNN